MGKMKQVHTTDDLRMMQALPLNLKIGLSEMRIRAWVQYWGEDRCYISFSGGKDSTVLLHLVRNIYPDIPAVYADTSNEYPSIKEFVQTFDNVTVVHPKMGFAKVIKEYGYPVISKEVSEAVESSRRWLDEMLANQNGGGVRSTDISSIDSLAKVYMQALSEKKDVKATYFPHRLLGISEKRVLDAIKNVADQIATTSADKGGARLSTENSEDLKNIPQKFAKMLGWYSADNEITMGGLFGKDRSNYSLEHYAYLLDAPFKISKKCCDIMKKAPIHEYEKETGRDRPFVGTMAEESNLRAQAWLRNGCNAFDSSDPKSQPMAFWTEQDVLRYIKEYNIALPPPYGEIVEDYRKEGLVEGQIRMDCDATLPLLKTTGAQRTGCLLCGFGCHLESRKGRKGRFEMLKEEYPNIYEWGMKPVSEGGLGYKDVIDWLNENGNTKIRY